MMNIGNIHRMLKILTTSDAKDFYRSYVADNKILPCNLALYKQILSYEPRTVFEFGCGQGKNLQYLNLPHLGIDISSKAVDLCRGKGLNVRCGDESTLSFLICYDVVFTCSVLDHIPEIDHIVAALKDLSRKAVVILETQDKIGKFYYSHDYEMYGFIPTGYEYLAKHQLGDGALYKLYTYEK